jgi:DNA-binding FadR family transcriptional regulator
MYRFVSGLSGNKVRALYINVLAESSLFCPEDEKRKIAVIDNLEAITQSHKKLIAAILERNPPKARRCMAKHRAMIAGVLA